MKLQQLRYIVEVASCGSVTEAARRLFVSQPSVTAAVRDLEREMGITVFDRTSKGMVTTTEGQTFLGYARQVLEQADLLEERYNRDVIGRMLRAEELEFKSLFSCAAHVFLSSTHPLSERASVTLDDLADYPYLSYEQGDFNSFYFSEEPLSTLGRSKNIRVRDRATLFNLLIGLDGYTVCSGVISHELNGEDIIAVPLEVDDRMEVGIVTRRDTHLSRYGKAFIEAIRTHIP